MNRFILRLAVMFLTFTLGLGSNFFFNGFSAIVERWIESPDPVLKEPSAQILARSDLSPFIPNCSLLVVKVFNDQSLMLNGEEMGNLQNTSRLVATLNELFRQRAEAHAHRGGLQRNSDVPEAERIERTVLIEAPRWNCHGEVSDLVEVIKTTGAKPIVLINGDQFAIE